jgi:molybdate transport system ATP-binding protein
MPETLSVRIAIERDKLKLDVNLQIPNGVTVLAGPSGSGKSTLLQAVAGLIRPGSGKIALGSQVWFEAGRQDVAPHARHVAYVFQSLALFPHLSVLDNVAYGIVRTPDSKERALKMLARMRISHLALRKPGTLSGGEAQRVALARAFATSPRVVLLDEPFSALDFDLKRELLGEVRSFARELDVPFLHVTHHRNEALAVGERLILLSDGKVAAAGDLASLWPVEELVTPLRSVKND